MTALATLDDVAAVSRAVPESDAEQVERLLEMVSAAVRHYTGQTFDLVEDDEITVYPIDGEVVLPQRPVVEVSSVAEFGTGNLGAGYFEALPSGRLYRIYQQYRQPWRYGKLTITYTHGYETIPADVAMVVAEVTAERWNASSVNPTGVASSGSQDVAGYSTSVSYRSPTASTTPWAPAHKAILDAYRPPTVGSVRVR